MVSTRYYCLFAVVGLLASASGHHAILGRAEGGAVPTGGRTGPALVITEFVVTHDFANLWTCEGTVLDSASSNITINFGNLPSVVGLSTTVNADGTFSMTFPLLDADSGFVSAQAIDDQGNVSRIVYYGVFPAH